MFIVGFGLVYPEKVGFCKLNDNVCIFKFPVFSVGEPLLFSSLFLITTSVILLLLKNNFYDIWKKFAKIFLPIALILIIITPTQHRGFVGIDKELATLCLSGLFLAGSLGIIIWKSIQLRKK